MSVNFAFSLRSAAGAIPCNSHPGHPTLPPPSRAPLPHLWSRFLPFPPSWPLAEPLLVPPYPPRGSTRPGWNLPCSHSGASSGPTPLCWYVAPLFAPAPPFLRSPLGFQAKYLVFPTIPDSASVRPSLGYNQPPASLVLPVDSQRLSSRFRSYFTAVAGFLRDVPFFLV